MSELTLSVHGVTARLRGDHEALAELAIHFAAFVSAGGPEDPEFGVELLRGAPVLDVPGRLVADQVVDRGVVYNRGDVTWVDHFGKATSRYDFGADRGRVVAFDVEDLVELGYLMVHSRLGVLLERNGLFRLHCLGLVVDGNAALVLAPSGGGKSRLAVALLTHTRAVLLGDDLVLVDMSGRVRGFHSPLGVSKREQGEPLGRVRSFNRRLHPPKWVVELDGLGPRLASGPVKPRLIVVARRVSEGESALVPLPGRELRSALWRDLVVGLGLPQVLELVARRGARDLGSLLPSAARRVRAAVALGRGARGATLEVGSPEGAALLLVAELSR